MGWAKEPWWGSVIEAPDAPKLWTFQPASRYEFFALRAVGRHCRAIAAAAVAEALRRDQAGRAKTKMLLS